MAKKRWLFSILFIAACTPSPVGKKDRDKEEENEGMVIRIVQHSPSKGGEGVETEYRPKVRDPELEYIRQRDERWQELQNKKTSEIREQQRKRKEQKRQQERELVSSLPQTERPTSVDQFRQVPHLPPVRQYYTGTCWSFSTTSFLESEVIRKTGRRVKLSEMATVYWEYLAKAGRYLDERGDSLFAEGSEANAVTRIWTEHGAWPLEAYPGFTGNDRRHDHIRMFREMKQLLESLGEKNLWDRDSGLEMLQVILDRHMGRPPETFEFEGKVYDPRRFMKEVLRIDPSEYVAFVSTMTKPFWQTVEFEVPDNWWHDASYYNAPLDDFYGGMKQAVQKGFSLVVAVDVSEPGKDADHDVLFVPPYDIPSGNIDQLARDYRFISHVTTDDHGVHVVGFTHYAGHDWFLLKDSGSSAQRGPNKGYYFMRDDYARLKVLSYLVHRDAVKDLLARFGKKQ
ncbi:MAG: peptidase C1 [Deltaproteobacteria bacterium]|nr:MAG: peptidase C1 [Deltaproteobacteria bacterium]